MAVGAAQTRRPAAAAVDCLSRLWKRLGKSEGKAVRIAQYYAQKSSVAATKVLVAQGFLPDHLAMARESAGPSDREPDAHLAVGGRQEIAEDRCKARPRAGSPGDAAGASRRRQHRGGRSQARPDLAATPASLRDSRHGAGSGGCVLRDAFRGR